MQSCSKELAGRTVLGRVPDPPSKRENRFLRRVPDPPSKRENRSQEKGVTLDKKTYRFLKKRLTNKIQAN